MTRPLRSLLLLGLCAGACGPTDGTPEPTPTPDLTETPTAGATPTATQAETPTATQAGTPTATAASTPTATPTPTQAPTPSPTATGAETPTATGAETPTATEAPTQTPDPCGAGGFVISKYVEGISGFNKALELYNGTDASVDLSTVALWRISNGGDWPEFELALSGALAPGQAYVIAHDQADDAAILAAADRLDAFINFNGDDAVGLAVNGVLVDAVGTDGADPGDGWDVAGVPLGTQNAGLFRKASGAPTTDWAASAGTNAQDSQWIVLPAVSATGYLGVHPQAGVLGHQCDAPGVCRYVIPAGDMVRGACGPNSGDNACAEGALGYHPLAAITEAPVRTLTLSAFYLDPLEVTVDRYRACVDGGGCEAAATGTDLCNYDAEDRGDHPINCVDWNQATAYCAWAGGRLPTEAEWEKAARGGCEIGGDRAACEAGLDDRAYPWGADVPACYHGNLKTSDGFCVYGTAPVGTYASGRSPYGISDMAGNVREWVSDWFVGNYYDSNYPGGSPSQDPEGGDQPGTNVRGERGGDWGSLEGALRVSARSGSSPTAGGENYGFRCAYDAPESSPPLDPLCRAAR